MNRKKCGCWDNGLRENMTWDELLTEIVRPQKYCTAGRWICPTLDYELRRADVERQRRKQYNKRLKRQGFTNAQIAEMPVKRRNRSRGSETVPEFNFSPMRRKVKA